MTHQETTDRINALANALNSIKEWMGSYAFIGEKYDEFHKASDDICSELSKLTQQD